MKKLIIICCLTFGAIGFFSSCSPYYYDRGYSYTPQPRVYVAPRVVVRPAPYYYTPRYHRNRGHYRRY